MPLNKSWHEYNESLIQRGRILMDISFLRSSNAEIKNMNKGKVGAPFEYSRTYIQFLAFLKIGFKISYRTVQGIVRGLSDYLRIEEIHFTQIRRRILKVKPSVGNLNPDNDDDSKPITLIVDASGLTITKKGDYIEQKWIRKKKEFIKLHIAVDAKSEKIGVDPSFWERFLHYLIDTPNQYLSPLFALLLPPSPFDVLASILK